MNKHDVETFVNTTWDTSIIPALIDFIKIPNQSPMFDENWQQNGYMQQAVDLIADWCKANGPKNMKLEVVTLPGRTPVIFMDVPGKSSDTILLYGHLDKQPAMDGWESDLGPWKPVLKNDKLYGRGGADDGYAAFATITAINALQRQGIAHARCVIIIEACEESGSTDLPFYIEYLSERIGNPSLVICLDSGCGNYEQLWSTTSLRGIVGGNLTVEILKEGLHSGAFSGVVPSSFRIIRDLLNRIEDVKTGKILLPELYIDIPPQRLEQTKKAAKILGKSIYTAIPFVEGAIPMDYDLEELLLNRTWRPTLSITGAGGLPALNKAGNVLRTKTALKLSFRIPPYVDPHKANQAIKKALEENPPYNAKVVYEVDCDNFGWDAPALKPWLEKACDDASMNYFGKPCSYIGEGGSIPFMGMLGEKFPEAQFLITGVLGPHSNAHGPNEFLHIPMGKKVTSCVAEVIAAHCVR